MSMLAAPRRPAGCVSDFLLDRLIADDGAGDPDAANIRAHLASCPRCSNRLAELESVEAPSFRNLFAHSIERKPPRRAGRWTMATIAVTAAAGLVFSARIKRTDDPPAAARTKGALSLDLALRRPSGEVTRPAQGDIVFPGDALRFEITAARPGFVTVLALDASGAVTVYAPASESTLQLEAGVPTLLPGSIVADRTLGPERIVAVLCAEAPDLEELRQAALRALLQAGGAPQRVTELGTPCTEASFMIEKRNRP